MLWLCTRKFKFRYLLILEIFIVQMAHYLLPVVLYVYVGVQVAVLGFYVCMGCIGIITGLV
jgi:hypothetical protein